MTFLLLSFAVALTASAVLSALARIAAPAVGLVDLPGSEEHKSHENVVPYGGGPAVLAASALSVAVVLFVFPVLAGRPHSNPVSEADWHSLSWLGAGALLMMLVGTFDDFRPLSPSVKLLLQFAVAALVVVAGRVTVTLFIPVRPVGMVISVVWLVLVTNVMNLLDNHDGVAGGVGAIACLFLGMLCANNGEEAAAVVLLGLAGALGGFLIYNFPPARIYLGDGGSLPVGFLLGGLCIVPSFYNQAEPSSLPLAVFAPLFILAVPLFDTVRVFSLRIFSGRPVFKADRRHLSHRLTDLGYTPREVAGIHYLLTLLTGSGAVLLPGVGWQGAFLLLAQVFGILMLVLILERGSGVPSN